MKHKKLLTIVICVLVAGLSHAQQTNLASSIIDGFQQKLKSSPYTIIGADGHAIHSPKLLLERSWKGDTCYSFVVNKTGKAISISDIVLFDIANHQLPRDAAVYGEGFQMLHQNGGTIAKRENIGDYSDTAHYRIPDFEGMPTAYGVMSVSINTNNHLLLGFTSCNRFIGRISYNSKRLVISFDAEARTLKPNEKWQLESFVLLSGKSEVGLYNKLAASLSHRYPRFNPGNIPIGWCSWYCYGPDVTSDDITENLQAFSLELPQLKYIQIDDGYQPYMGDWLDSNASYGDIKQTIAGIRQKGYEPAIWIAPFIAEAKSRVFKEHPEWFVKDSSGKPLNSSTVGFGGWRNGPWYVLDGTNPQVQAHLTHLIKVMREQWGVNYFKMDANYWGAIHKGIHYDENATRIEAYRLGLQAIIKGCDSKTVLLGCNAPIWPSIGLVSAMRTSGDINRSWQTVKQTGIENLHRAWQNGKLWDADPDCILLTDDKDPSDAGNLTQEEKLFHATVIHACGGAMINGDKASKLRKDDFAILHKMLPSTGQGIQFFDASLQTGFTQVSGKKYYYFFNWSENNAVDLNVPLNGKSHLIDFWTGEDIGVFTNRFSIKKIPPHTARLIVTN